MQLFFLKNWLLFDSGDTQTSVRISAQLLENADWKGKIWSQSLILFLFVFISNNQDIQQIRFVSQRPTQTKARSLLDQ